jgi:hypothetical protein
MNPNAVTVYGVMRDPNYKPPLPNAQREKGFYWVLYHGEWVAAEWCAGWSAWALCGIENDFNDEDLDQIGEKINK